MRFLPILILLLISTAIVFGEDKISKECESTKLFHIIVITRTLSDRCNKPIKTGRCRAAFEKYAYNTTSGDCVMFIYGGCRGNSNRFEYIEQCQDICL